MHAQFPAPESGNKCGRASDLRPKVRLRHRAFATWALARSILFRQGRTVTAGAAAGGVTLVGALMAGGCFLIGCCGSPMLTVYLSLFGAKALGLGKPLMALVTLVSVSCGYWCLSRRLARGSTLQESRRNGSIKGRQSNPEAITSRPDNRSQGR